MLVLLIGFLALIALVYLLLCVIGTRKSKRFFRRKIWVLPLILVVICFGVRMLITNSAQKTEEECQQMVADSIDQLLCAFDEAHGSQGISYEIEYNKMKLKQPTFSWSEFLLVEPGLLEAEITAFVDTPAAYPYCEKDSESYTIEDLAALSELQQDLFAADVKADARWTRNVRADVIFLDREGNEYMLESGKLLKNGEPVFEDTFVPIPFDPSDSGKSDGKCNRCNGTGYVRYNYGNSDMEAWLSGHDAYTYGPCSSCGGTGRSR